MAAQPLSLIDRTNASATQKDHGQPKLRRSKSSQSLAHDFGSSGTASTIHDSIYNAELVMSSEDLCFLQDLEPSQSHLRWPPTRLEPIIERKSGSTLRTASSSPQLRRNPEQNYQVVRRKISIRSIRPKNSTSCNSGQTENSSQHVRSFSLNDLDCLPKSDTKQAFRKGHNRSSSSSTKISSAIRQCMIYPLRPIAEPPYRSPTPPGLPSFRTREAQELRLSPVNTQSGPLCFLSRWLRQNHTEEDPASIVSGSRPTSPTSLSSGPISPPMDMLQRILGTPRVINLPPSEPSSVIRLPPGVTMEHSPGILIQAEDGTAVRGRWHQRMSAHGVGNRPLESHPLSRVVRQQVTAPPPPTPSSPPPVAPVQEPNPYPVPRQTQIPGNGKKENMSC